MSIVLFGPPGAGKGTQSQLLTDRNTIKHLSTGDLFRKAMGEGSPLGLEAKSYVDAGKLVPDTVTIGLVRELLEKNINTDYIFDGFPRTENQAKALEEMISAINAKPISRAIFLEVDEKILVDRLSGRRVCKNCNAVYHIQSKPSKVEGVCDLCGGLVYQRKDDGVDVISTRLKAYEENTKPLKKYYSDVGLFTSINGEGETESIYKNIKKFVQ